MVQIYLQVLLITHLSRDLEDIRRMNHELTYFLLSDTWNLTFGLRESNVHPCFESQV